MNSTADLIERLKELIPQGDGYNSEYSHTIQEAITALSLIMPDEVAYQIQTLSDPACIISIRQQQFIADLLERQERRIDELEAQAREYKRFNDNETARASGLESQRDQLAEALEYFGGKITSKRIMGEK